MRRRGKLWVWDWRMIPNFEHSYDTAILTMEGRLRSEGYDYDLCLPHTSEKSKYHEYVLTVEVEVAVQLLYRYLYKKLVRHAFAVRHKTHPIHDAHTYFSRYIVA